MTNTHRKLKGGEIKTYQACDALEHTIRAIYKKVGLHQASSHSGRKSMVTSAIINKGRTLEEMDCPDLLILITG